ncbi:MotA/TolQ/ExbB proton channel family protein [uncultured Parasutterella sp.]|uniref:MotA/TolQ/ExbB proton channel family protein n=1 Tax=uncultured Parasutterella sp. TaxID=1263098 RepID=UPI00272CA464|nr:MotA/TolQ/ExbB proton channel family protein [uncultured Parasutterella sp.]
MNFTQIYDLIGCAGVVLFIVGIAAVYITVWNIIYLRGVLRSFKGSFRGMENTTAERIRRAYGKSTNPLICIVRDVVTTHAAHSEDIRAEVAYLFHKNFKPVNNALTWLKLIAAVSPLLGLLGTVLGMVRVFRAIAENVSPDPTMLAAGIWTALVTTVMGLVVAIPALMAYYYLTLRIKELRIEAVEYSYRSLESARVAAKYEAEQAAA